MTSNRAKSRSKSGTRITAHASKAQRVLLGSLIVVAIAAIIAIILQINGYFLTATPAAGGRVVEGVLGTPRTINPLLATTNADKDLTALIYSGLLKPESDGSFSPDLAESYSVSEDGLQYTFILREGLVWHDGEPVTSSDVAFTIHTAQNPRVESVKMSDWDGVLVLTPDPRTVILTLSEPYSPFIANATLGILPEHLWSTVDISTFQQDFLNASPIGTGPYTIDKIKRDDRGLPTHYDLSPFTEYVHGTPYIQRIRFQFYPSEEALVEAYINTDIDSFIAPSRSAIDQVLFHFASLEESVSPLITEIPLPRVYGVFFNQNKQPIFTAPEVRKALAFATDREDLVQKALGGYAEVITGPLPPSAIGYEKKELLRSDLTGSSSPEQSTTDYALDLLSNAGWTKTATSGILTNSDDESLSFTIATVDANDLTIVAEEIKRQWSLLGVEVEVQVFDPGNLEEFVLRPRDYDALLFGEAIGRDSDPYAFWHSSQRLDPGLNIALYTNITVDNVLERARIATSTQERAELYSQFQDEFFTDMPALFLYAPTMVYFPSKEVKNQQSTGITETSERFIGISQWYTETEMLWPMFTN